MIQIKTRGDKIIIEGIGTFPAEALEFRQEANGRLSVFNTWENRFVVFEARSEVISDEAGKQLVGTGQTLSEAVTQKLPVAPTGAASYFYIWAEENSALTNNRHEWSFGAGYENNQANFLLSRPARIVKMGLRVRLAPKSSCVVELIVNGQSAAAVNLPVGENQKIITIDPPIEVGAGDLFVFRTVLAGKAKDGVVHVILEPKADA